MLTCSKEMLLVWIITEFFARFMCHICMIFFFKVHEFHWTPSFLLCEKYLPLKAGFSGFISDCWYIASLQGSFLTIQNLMVLGGGRGGGGHLRSFSVLRTQELHDDTNWNSCRRQHLLPASSVCGSVFKFVCARKNFCREFNSTRRACSNPTVPRYRMLGMDRWENITCTNDLLWSSQVNINQALVSRFTSLPLLPPAFNSNPVISVMHDTWKEPFYLKWKFKFFLFLERVSSICSDWDDQKH